MKSSAFSLVEVVLALGVFAFVAVALIALFSVGLRTNRESVDELEATNLAQSLFETRRAAPTADLPGFPLPSLAAAAAVAPESPLYLTGDGQLTSTQSEARFGFIYRISPPAQSSPQSSAYVCLFWPPTSGVTNAQGMCEMVSSFAIP